MTGQTCAIRNASHLVHMCIALLQIWFETQRYHPVGLDEPSIDVSDAQLEADRVNRKAGVT